MPRALPRDYRPPSILTHVLEESNQTTASDTARQPILGPVWSQSCVYTARHSVFSFLSLLPDGRKGLKSQIKEARAPHEILTHDLTRQKYDTLVFYWPHICTYCSRPTLPTSPLTESVPFHSGREASASWSLLAFGGCVEDHSFSRVTRLNKRPKFRLRWLAFPALVFVWTFLWLPLSLERNASCWMWKRKNKQKKKKHSPLLRALNHLITLESGRWRRVRECLVFTTPSGRSHLGIMEREQFCPRLSLNAEVGLSASPLLFFFLPQIGGNVLANLRLLIKCGRRLKWHPQLGGKNHLWGGLCFKKNKKP